MNNGRFTWAARNLNSVNPHADRHARRADLRARILAVLASCAEGITSGDLADELATRAKRGETSAEVKRMAVDGLCIYETRLRAHGARWYLTDAGTAASKAAA